MISRIIVAPIAWRADLSVIVVKHVSLAAELSPPIGGSRVAGGIDLMLRMSHLNGTAKRV